jgi:tetratricopeptide (TPR) repeat protein
VDAIVEGSLRESEGRIRVLVQMVTAQTGAALWAEQFDERFTDIFALEDRIAEQICQTLLPELTGGERQRLVHRVTASSEAYRLYLQGRYFWNKRTPAALEKGIGYFREAIDADPGFARAWAGLADSELLGASSASPRDAMERARAAATKAAEIDDSLAEAHTSLGRIAMSFDLDWTRAQAAFQRAIALNPNCATAPAPRAGPHRRRAGVDAPRPRSRAVLAHPQHRRRMGALHVQALRRSHQQLPRHS